MEDELRYYIWISQALGCGNNKLIEILSSFLSLKDLYDKSVEEMEELSFLDKRDVLALKNFSMSKVDKIIEDCETLGIKIVTARDKRFPKCLLEIYGAPIVLYYKGNIKYLGRQISIGMVGTRNITQYSKKITFELSQKLTKAGILIVSGGANGVDTVAHDGALSVGGRTFVVMACGVNVNYPTDNEKQREDILKNGGAIISELPPYTPVKGGYFHTRNRLISGLSHGVCITHAPKRSGSLITAQYAVEQGKEVFCVPPWDITDYACMGVMPYIREGCIVVGDVSDIISEFTACMSSYKEVEVEDKFLQVKKRLLIKLDTNNIDRAKKSKKQKRYAILPDEDNSNKEDSDNNIGNNDVSTNNITLEEFKIKNQSYYDNLEEEQKQVFDCLGDHLVSIDEIFLKTGLGVNSVLTILTDFEHDRIVLTHSGRRYSFNLNLD